MKPGVQTRLTAAAMVGRVMRQGAWTNVISRDLDLPPEDTPLVRHLLYGTVRNLARIDRAIDALSNRPVGAIDDEVVDVLRIAFQEAMFGRTASHAVADSAVEAVKELGQPRAAGFVNALVRRLLRDGEPDPPTTIADRYGIPEWIVDSLGEAWSTTVANDFVVASHEEAARTVRLREEGAAPPLGALPTPVHGVFLLPEGPVPDGTIIQDPASAAVGLAVAPEPGDVVLDVAAAPGGKSLALSDAGAWVIAGDNHARRVAGGQRRTRSIGFNGAWLVADGTRPPFAEATFDRVLVDAPCTGLGTLRRRPEIRHKVTTGDRDRLAALQQRLLRATVPLVRPGGRLVYSVCTVLPEETIEIVEGHGGRPPAGVPGTPWGDGLLMAPHLTGTDGMFICVFER